MTQATPNAELLVSRLVALATETGLPVVITADQAGIEIGVLNLVDLSDDDYFHRPISAEELMNERSQGEGEGEA